MNKKICNLILIFIMMLITVVCVIMICVKNTNITKAEWAVICQNGKEIKRINLQNVYEPYDIDIECEFGKNTIHVEQGKICISYADCPDKVCVKQGYIKNSAFPIVCLPHKLSISIENANEEYDTVAGGVEHKGN